MQRFLPVKLTRYRSMHTSSVVKLSSNCDCLSNEHRRPHSRAEKLLWDLSRLAEAREGSGSQVSFLSRHSPQRHLSAKMPLHDESLRSKHCGTLGKIDLPCLQRTISSEWPKSRCRNLKHTRGPHPSASTPRLPSSGFQRSWQTSPPTIPAPRTSEHCRPFELIETLDTSVPSENSLESTELDRLGDSWFLQIEPSDDQV